MINYEIYIILLLLLNKYYLLEQNNANNKCDLGLINSLGFQGSSSPLNITLQLCPMVSNPCCNIEDQFKLFEYWENGPQRLLLHDADESESLYSKLFSSLISIHDYSNTILHNMKNKSMNNCKAMATIISKYDFSIIQPKITEYIKKMNTFILNSLKGVYCSVCDYKLKRYFNVNSLSIQLNAQFCRGIVENSLVLLAYQNIYFPKLFNIITKMLMTCNIRGRFDEKMALKDLWVYFEETEAIEDAIKNCIDNRNNSSWFGSCLTLCNKFNIDKYNKFYFLDNKKTSYFIKMIDKILLNRTNSRRLEVSTTPNMKMNQRKLMEDIKPYKIEDNFTKDKKGEQNYFYSSPNATMHLYDFSISVAEDGVDLKGSGLSSNFNKETYYELKKVVEELKKKQAIINEYENKSEDNNLKNRLNKIGAAITGDDGINYSNIYSLFIVLFFSLFN